MNTQNLQQESNIPASLSKLLFWARYIYRLVQNRWNSSAIALNNKYVILLELAHASSDSLTRSPTHSIKVYKSMNLSIQALF